jgi:hypothetical protein
VVLVTQAFEKLAAVVAAGSKLSALHRHVLPHPLNPLPDDRVKAITREHLKGIVGKLLTELPK